MASEYAIKQQICEIGKRIYDRGMVANNDGNISVKIGPDEFLCTPTGVSKGFMTPEYICKVDKDGNVLALAPGCATIACTTVLGFSDTVKVLVYEYEGNDELANELNKFFPCDYDEAGSIGKRYRREDEIGTPLCITVDFQTVGDETTEADNCVTVRDRDTMEQVRIPISELKAYIAAKCAF